jgi:hypothetical protein
LATLTVAVVTAFSALLVLAFINGILAFTVALILFVGAAISIASGHKIHDRVKEINNAATIVSPACTKPITINLKNKRLRLAVNIFGIAIIKID